MQRRSDIDWLRIGATYLLFVFHVGKVFDPAPFFHIRNADQSFVLLIVCGFISLWHMPLFFLLAGWSAASSLRVRGAQAFLRERAFRLGVPLVAGCVLLAPAIKYLELRSGLDLSHTGLRVAAEHQDALRLLVPGGLPVAPPFNESFFTFLPTFFTQLDRFTWSHLWFVAYLLTLTVLCLPVFLWLVRGRGRLGHSRWTLYAPLVPLILIQLTMRGRWPGIYNLYNDWANVAYYTVFLVSGFVFACHPKLEDAVAKEWKRSLGVGIAAMLLLLLAVLGVFSSPSALLVGSAVAGWCFVLALLGVARRFFTSTTPVLGYLSESAFPVYVLHQAAIVVPGYVVVGLPLGIATKFALLLLVAVVLTMSTYHWLVRPFAVPRSLLGMKAKACSLRQPAALSASAAAALLAVVGSALPSAASPSAATPVGVWYAEGGAAKVRIETCGEETLCGRVLWLRSPNDEDGCPLRDVHNPEPSLRDRQVEGLEVLHGLTRRQDGTWAHGSIYDPGSGYTYRCQVTLDGPDRLRLRGYLGVPLIGRTTTWTRVGSESRLCAGGAP